jgi:hypothetical protein
MADPSPFRDAKLRQAVLNYLRVLGVQEVKIRFSGSGDSGQVDDVSSTPEVDLTVGAFEYDEARGSQYSDGGWKEIIVRNTGSLKEVLETMAYDAAAAVPGDWVNNEGGQGDVTIDLTAEPAIITLHIGFNVTSVDEHQYEFPNI